MSAFEHSRFQIWNQLQHPLKHTLSDFGFSNPALAGVSTVEAALNYIIAAIYPNAKAAVANVAALPASGNTINDYRVVQDDGDGKAASYRWEQREGEVSPSWHKVMDIDWSTDSILAAYLDVTQDLYVFKNGKSDLDGAGAVITGLYAGQTIFGGNAINQNLTLKANSGDGVGAPTGWVQVDDHFRPAQHNLWDLGTSAKKFKDEYLSGSIFVGTLTATSGSISDSGGSISFGSNNLSTTGDFSATNVTGTNSVKINSGGNLMTLTAGSIVSATGAISFGVANLTTTGTLDSAAHTITESGQTLILDANNGSSKATILSSLGTINFGSSLLETTGNISGAFGTFTKVTVDSIVLDSDLIESTTADLRLNSNTTIKLLKAAETLGITANGAITTAGTGNIDNGYLQLNANELRAINTNGDVILNPNGTGVSKSTAHFLPTNNGTKDLGSSSFLWRDLYLGTSIKDAANAITVSTLMSLRSAMFRDLAQTVPAVAGDTLFWDSVNSVWLASHPDSEVTHSELSGLTSGDAGHTQFAMLAGRASGQTLQGGTGNGEHLVLESTSGATKGSVKTKDNFVPFTDAVYNISVWDGTDLGDATHNFRHLHMKGEAKGLRLENFTSGTLPAASMQNVGRAVWATDVNRLYVDNGVSFSVVAGINKFQSDTSWNGSDLTKDVTVSGSITDARTAIWQLRDNANNFEVMFVKIETISASVVRITTTVALPAGSYRLIGIE